MHCSSVQYGLAGRSPLVELVARQLQSALGRNLALGVGRWFSQELYDIDGAGR
jgi:hypothetical protein